VSAGAAIAVGDTFWVEMRDGELSARREGSVEDTA
jgi:hypothetical protein